MKSQPQNTEFRNNPVNFHPSSCIDTTWNCYTVTYGKPHHETYFHCQICHMVAWSFYLFIFFFWGGGGGGKGDFNAPPSRSTPLKGEWHFVLVLIWLNQISQEPVSIRPQNICLDWWLRKLTQFYVLEIISIIHPKNSLVMWLICNAFAFIILFLPFLKLKFCDCHFWVVLDFTSLYCKFCIKLFYCQ